MKFSLSKKLTAGIMAGLMAISAAPAGAMAKSLEESFYSGTSVNYDHYDWLTGAHYTKSCWAGTSGYSGRHYVRAMIGSGQNVWADTDRCYSYGDIERTCTTGSIACHGWSCEFPMGYAYYGN